MSDQISSTGDSPEEPPPSDLNPDFQLSSDNASPPSPKLSHWRSGYVIAVFLALLVGWPLLSVLSPSSSKDVIESLTSASRLGVYLNTVLLLWAVFFMVLSAQWAGRRSLSELGFVAPRLSDPLVAFAFLFAANLALNGLSWVFTSFGLESPELTIKALLPITLGERVGWILMSISAGICEESCFRGFLLVRATKWLGGRWWPAVIASSVAFGVGHLYQGTSGSILIAIYGGMFCALRIWRGSLWPGIWAHIWQDLGAMALGGWAGY